ncbi:MAG: hypothetical protein QOH06_412 [Acidobacteriota bacterium]|nr:hypothetical protein [Acidobacteriota bacterium]
MPATFRSSLSALLFLLASVSLAQEPAPAGPPYRVGGNVTRPEKVSGEPPAYTIEARKARVQGVVIVEAVIDEQGNVMDAKVLKGLPAGLDEATLEAVRSWKFDPARMDGKPVPVYYTLTVNYTVEEEPQALRARNVFWDFALKHPELETLLRGRHLPEALAYLEDMADTPEVQFARAFVLTELHRYGDAMEAAPADGPGREMIFQLVALLSLTELAERSMAGEDDGLLEIGLRAATAALDANPESQEAMLVKSRLLRQKAKLVADEAARGAMLDEAGELEKQAGKPQLAPAILAPAPAPAPAGPPYRVEGDVKRPEKISGRPPIYTSNAREARVTGVVVLDTLIDEKGNVTDVKVLQGLPMGLDEAAVEAVKRWKFKPATLDGQPVPVYYTLTVSFMVYSK